MKDVMTYVFSEVSKEDEADYKTIKTNLTQLKNKLDKIEERYAIGEISHEIYAKFSKQYTVEIIMNHLHVQLIPKLRCIYDTDTLE